MIIKRKTMKKLACTIKISMYKSVVFLSFLKIVNFTIFNWTWQFIDVCEIFFFFFLGGGGLEMSFMPSLSISSSCFLNVIPSPVTEKPFFWNQSRNSRKRIPFWQDVSFFVSLYVTWILGISDILPFQNKFRGKSLKISIINFFHLPSFPSFSCKVVLPISLENPKDT